MATHFTAGAGAIFAQVDGPGTEPKYLGCHEVGDISEPLGDITLIRCPDPSGPSRYRTVGQVQAAGGAVTTTITTDVTDSPDELEYVKNCAFNLFINMIKGGRKDNFANSARSFILLNSRLTQKGVTGITSRTDDDEDRSGQTFDISADELLRWFKLSYVVQTTSNATEAFDISFCNEEQCRTDEDVAMSLCEVGYICTASGTAAAGVILKTVNGGGTWTATTTDPFAVATEPISITCFPMGSDSHRVMTVRGTADAGGMDISYSDNSGTNWTEVNADATVGNFGGGRFCLHARSRNNIWVGNNEGAIFHSANAGVTWTEQLATTIITATDISCIRFVDDEVGFFAAQANDMGFTIDGGTSWSALAGEATKAAVNINVIEPIDRNRVWVGYDDGTMWRTVDGGTNWSQASFTNSGLGAVNDIRFLNDLIGYALVDDATPDGIVITTKDGGYTWEDLTTPSNAGLNALWLCDLWNNYFVGKPEAALTMIGKGTA